MFFPFTFPSPCPAFGEVFLQMLRGKFQLTSCLSISSACIPSFCFSWKSGKPHILFFLFVNCYLSVLYFSLSG